ncbi:TonB-dependent receptor [Novosphingobium flavum]|uniref:TonB-dependent receptor n=1 Tax=Novosphingobium flavum TaxID=1778672 RepID=A0A7X1FRZ0_9SPHN|nr:TonB-dependent receptor [Novosphingobium flavum]MBC2665843.1 TonB-dependent receptor [Novosphingobium flavum]
MLHLRQASLLACASLIAVSTSAFAQSAAETDKTEEIIVTGSRVVVNGNDSPTPVTVVTMDQMNDVRPANVADQLNDLPQFSNSQNQNNGQGGGSANGGNPNPTGNVLNLRNFGQTRNLILFDGHRVAPNSANGTVDIDMIPQLLLKRTDVVTGGASAVYGADAVTGVVNFITDTKFVGLKLNAQAGISTYGDGGQQRLGAAWGANVGDRGHVELSYEYSNDDGISNRSSRPWGAARYQFGQVGGTTTINGVPTATYAFTTLAARSQNSFGGTIQSVAGQPANPYNNYYIPTVGTLTPMTGGTPINANVVPNGSGGWFDTSLRAALRMHQAFGRFDYELSDNIKFYVRGAYTKTTNAGYGIPNPTYIPNSGNFVPVFVSNPYFQAQFPTQAAAMTAAGDTTFQFGKLFGGPSMNDYRQFTKTFGTNWSVDAGFNGDIGGWRWEASYLHSENTQRTVAYSAINGRKVAASADAVVENGVIKCYVNTAAGQALLSAALKSFYSGCVPGSTLFGPTLNAAEADWMFDPLEVTTKIKMDDVEAFIAGSPFSTWAGPVQVAISGQARKQTYQVISSSSPATLANPLDCTGLRLLTGAYACNATSLDYFQAESLSRAPISVSVKEGAVEAQVPLLKDVPFFRSLQVNGAARITNYSTSGTVWSWKVGLDWDVTADLTLRVTRSRDIRAPTLHELYQPQVIGSYNGTDALIGATLQAPNTPAGQLTQGNANLRPEKANTFTAGLVYKPSWAPGLSLAVDYFDISIRDAIVTLNGTDTNTQNDCIASGGTSPSCALIVRKYDCCTPIVNGVTNQATTFYVSPVNVARQYTRGVDIELNYATTIASRPFNLRLLSTYQPKNVYVDGITGVQYNNAGSGLAFGTAGNVGAGAKFRATLIANMEVADGVRIGISERYRGPMTWVPAITAGPKTPATAYVIQNAPANVPARLYTGFNVSFRTGPMEFFGNVQNVFNVQPAPWASINSGLPGNNNVAPGDDPIGRYFTAGVRLKF